jgi:hypothetical protein
VVKKISHEQSRRNSARADVVSSRGIVRRGHWGPRPVPMLTSQKIHCEIGGNVEATSFGGLFAMHRLVTRLGLVAAVDANLHLLKMHLPYQRAFCEVFVVRRRSIS